MHTHHSAHTPHGGYHTPVVVLDMQNLNKLSRMDLKFNYLLKAVKEFAFQIC